MTYTVYICSRNQSTGVRTRSNVTSGILNAFSSVDKLDESLDIGQITVNGLYDAEPYDMFDWVEVEIDGTVVLSQRIAGDSTKLISKNPVRYEHTLTLVEHTKILERFVISGKTFRQPTDGSTLKTITDVVTDLLNTVPLEVQNLYLTTRLFKLPTSGTLRDLMDDTDAPEFTFKDITFREALNQVFGYIDVIPRLYMDGSDLTLTGDFVNELKSLIGSESLFIEKSSQQDIDYYATNIESDALNVVNDVGVSESTEFYPPFGLYITGRSNEFIYDFTKSFIPTPKPISSVTKLLIKPTGVTYEQISPNVDIYISDNKVFYYDDILDFPATGKDDIYYCDISDSEKMYIWNGTSYDVSATTPASNLTPKIRFIATSSDFTSTLNYTDQYDVFVAIDTGIAYRYNTGTTFTILNNFDSDGEIVLNATDRVYEKNAYNLLDIDTGTALQRRNPTNFYQSNTFYYNYRNKNIEFGSTSGVFGTTSSLELVVYIKMYEALVEDGFITGDFDDYTPSLSSENVVLYNTGYVPISSSVRFNIDREDLSDVSYNSTILSNQQSRIVNLENFTNNLHGRINRIGNSEIQLEHRVSDINDLYEVGDYTSDGFILTQRELIFYKPYIYAKYGLSKNYNMISKFIGVNSEIRQWQIDEQNTLKRKLVYSEYVEIKAQVSSEQGSADSKLITLQGRTCFLETLKNTSTYGSVGGAYIDSSETTEEMICEMSSNGGGSSLIFDFQLPSNRYVGLGIEGISDGATTQRASSFEPYTDSYGEMTSMDLTIFDTVSPDAITQTELQALADNLPVFDETIVQNKYFDTSSPFYVLKDSAEEIGMTYELKLVSDPSSLIIGRKFITRNRLVNENPPSSFKLYTSTTNTLNRYDNYKFDTSASGWTNQGTISPTVNPTSNKISIPTVTASMTAWVILDEDDFVLIGVNQDGTLLNTLTFDFLNKRTGVKYKY